MNKLDTRSNTVGRELKEEERRPEDEIEIEQKKLKGELRERRETQ